MSRTKLRCSFYGLGFQHQLFSKPLWPCSDLPSYSAARWPVGGLGSSVSHSLVFSVHSVLSKVRFMCTQHTQRTGSKLGEEDVKAVYRHPPCLTSMQSISCKMLGWMKHKLESRLLGEISCLLLLNWESEPRSMTTGYSLSTFSHSL